MKRVYGYLRVSTLQQGEHGVSLDEQRAAIERYAQRHNLTIIQWFEERETAAKRGRPVFNRMLQHLKAARADGVIIHKIDRSARHLRDWADLGELVDRGCEIHFAHEGFDLHTRGGRLSADIQAVIAADFIRNLREETRKGFYGRLKQGIYPLPAPIGYRDQGRGQPKALDPERAPLVRKAFELYSTAQYNFDTLLTELRRMGLTNRNGGRVTRNGLTHLLNNPFYTGLIRLKSTGEMFSGSHRPLISRALFQRVQDILTGKVNTRIQRYDFLFRRRLQCKCCGYSLIGEVQKGHTYYRCHTKGCPTTTVREDHVENQLLSVFEPVQLTEDEVMQLMAKLDDLRRNSEKHQHDQIAAMKLNIKRVQDRFHRLTDAYVDQMIDASDYQERRAALLEDKQRLNQSLEEVQNEGMEPIAKRVSENLELAQSLYQSYISADTPERRDLVDQVTSNRQVERKNLEISLQLPFWELANRHEYANGDLRPDASRNYLDNLLQKLIAFFSDDNNEPRDGLSAA